MKINGKYQTEEIVHGNNIPKHRNKLPCPKRKKSFWERYAKGERLNPTYNKVFPVSNIVMPSKVIESPPIPDKYGANPFFELADFLLNGFKKIIKS